MTCEKLIQIAITISTTFTASPNHCQGARLTWNQGFTSSEQQVGWRFACTGTIFFCKLTSAFAWTRLLGAGVLPPRHLARQLTSIRSATSLHLSAHYLLRSVPLKQRLVQCTYLKGQADKLFLKCILEQYRPALEILGLLQGADGGGIIHRQTSWSGSESLSVWTSSSWTFYPLLRRWTISLKKCFQAVYFRLSALIYLISYSSHSPRMIQLLTSG